MFSWKKTSTQVFALALMMAGPAQADVVNDYFANDAQFLYEISHMPDLDQRRADGDTEYGLPADGSMYCAPTSVMNLVMYIANHGFPEVVPGPANWQSNNHYNSAGVNIFLMGLNMDTDAQGGTNGQGWIDGTQQWLGPYPKFTINNYFAAGNYAPSFLGMSKTALNGSIVAFCYGRYDLIGSYGGLPLIDRTGGHCITMAKAHRNGSLKELWSRDPADDSDDLYSQSQFGNRKYTVNDHSVYVCQAASCKQVLSHLTIPNSDTLRYIDGYISIAPKAGYSFTDQTLLYYVPYPLFGSQQQQLNQFEAPLNSAIIDAIGNPDGFGFVLIQEGFGGAPDSLHMLDALTGQGTPITNLPNASKVYFGRKRELYVLASDRVHCLDLNGPEPVIVTTALPHLSQAMTYDDAQDELVVISATDKKIMRYREFPGPPASVIAIPPQVVLGANCATAVNPVNGDVYVASDDSNIVYGLHVGATGGVTVEEIVVGNPDGSMPTAIDFDDYGRLYVSSKGMIVELVRGPTGGWVPPPDPQFEDFAVGPQFHVTRSRTNFNPVLHSGPGWVNIDPEELEFGGFEQDCDADVNRDGVVNIDDLFLVIASWGGAAGGAANVIGDQSINIDDLFAVIAAWGPCP